MPRNLLVAFAVLALTVGSVFPAGHRARSALLSHDSLDRATGEHSAGHAFTEAPEHVRVRLTCRLRRGELSLRLIDPGGRTVWSGEARGKTRIELDERFPGRAGEWQVELTYARASGRYRIQLAAE